ncbi:MAG TPA: (2Fe-2S)-binding protein [Gammaproteobacteria bacterium]|nr:(2Fe-2S)-binding protein [Gammaproteobacteria bacterium]
MELNHRISVTVNDEVHAIVVESRLSLLDFLREKLGLVGAHAGCEHGVCGTCTVIVDGKSVRSCLMLAVQANGTSIQTVEGLAIDGELSPLQEAFWNKQALQCGFCTPGMLLRATELLRANPDPSAAEIREALASNLCRCTGYAFIIEAVLEAAATTRERTA